MSQHRFPVDLTGTDDTGGTAGAPSHHRKPQYRHSLRYENPAGEAWTSPEGHTRRAPSGLTVVTCSCGLATEALPSDDARLVYEEHRNVIRDETMRDDLR
ncbi:hypothetical protein ADK52_18260 [Streptomyces sp. WM6372]|uniref:hypothetical protein n=1 Tax=Streptomyces sp. WM6372 TaxID=1415555 RepID=UPI0006AE13E3|nr:hypothetical protein [Streptomyces sp. WM6372]KOU23406.1 hypothetical protein ADK52_18260 [Streptomyces sp. WM6372]